ncbi:MAG: hypothetical protein AB4290_02690 [Spirulina sp.]
MQKLWRSRYTHWQWGDDASFLFFALAIFSLPSIFFSRGLGKSAIGSSLQNL